MRSDWLGQLVMVEQPECGEYRVAGAHKDTHLYSTILCDTYFAHYVVGAIKIQRHFKTSGLCIKHSSLADCYH